MQQRVDVGADVSSDQTGTVAGPMADEPSKSAREVELDAKIRFWTRLFVALMVFAGASKAYVLLGPQHLW